MEIIGLDHVYLAVTDLPRSEAFYDPVMERLGFRKGTKPIAGEPHAHYFNRALQITLRPARPGTASHDPYAPGLHHLCLQAPDRAAVDAIERTLRELGVAVTAAAEYPEYNDDYYAVFFDDPDGIRLELVARSRYRRQIVEDWDAYRVFVNPVAELAERRKTRP